ncbi:hypothetical protein ABT392_04245 [Paucibacter sp. JuS9]|uniref:hypothetical protein n=1 Tax=Paucibacter sp. JuS9 TaxID=3228748 RepID=UPI0037578D57
MPTVPADSVARPKRATRYDQLNAAGHPKVTSILDARAAVEVTRVSSLRVERTANTLLIFGDGWQFDASHWLTEPEVVGAMLWGIEAWSVGQQSNTIDTRVAELDRGFWRYLAQENPQGAMGLQQLNTRWIGGFVKWLDRKDEAGIPVWSPATKTGHLTAFRVVLKKLMRSEEWAGRLAPNLQIPGTTWKGLARRNTPREVLDDATVARLLVACRDEVLATTTLLNSAWAEMDASEDQADTDALPSSAAAWRAIFARRYADTVPHDAWLRLHDVQLRSAPRRLGMSFVDLRRPVMPRARDLVPFVLLLAFPTSFNPDSLRGLRQSQIDYPDEFGGRRIRFRPPKGRAGRKQIRTFAIGDPLGPDALVAMVEAWTARIRHVAPATMQDRLFIFFSPMSETTESTEAPIGDFIGGSGAQMPRSWYTALRQFLAEHDLPKFTLAQVRPTSLDLVHELTGGDLKAVQTAGNQRAPQVILDHYTSDAARVRNNERLAAAMQTRDRLVETQGKAADPRKEPQEADRGCATPGFTCLDPFSSPMPTEVEGRLCKAYGMCPVCPLACVNLKSAYVGARLLQLRATVEAAQSELEPRRWQECWRPVSERLDDYWLRLFDDDVLTEAGALTLSPLPSVE